MIGSERHRSRATDATGNGVESTPLDNRACIRAQADRTRQDRTHRFVATPQATNRWHDTRFTRRQTPEFPTSTQVVEKPCEGM